MLNYGKRRNAEALFFSGPIEIIFSRLDEFPALLVQFGP